MENVISKEELTAEELAEMAEEMQGRIQKEKEALSNAMNPVYDDDERADFLEDAYCQHVCLNHGCRMVGKDKYEKYLKPIVNKEFEELEVKEFEEYLKG